MRHLCLLLLVAVLGCHNGMPSDDAACSQLPDLAQPTDLTQPQDMATPPDLCISCNPWINPCNKLGLMCHSDDGIHACCVPLKGDK
jgi:hypothetical protein